MQTLAIDTSGVTGSVALLENGICREERLLELGRHHGQALVPEIRKMLANHQLAPRDCGLIAVSVGPGSFTGLRVGIVCAKTLAYVVGCPIAAIDTLEAVAAGSPDQVLDVQVVSDAQRGELFVGRYCREAGGRWQRSGEIRILPATTWADQLKPDDWASGPGLENVIPTIAGRCQLLASEFRHPRAAVVGRLAERAATLGRVADVWNLEPLYLRRSSAEDKWEALGRA